jgi:DNA-binding XRE family transcriptional regulator
MTVQFVEIAGQKIAMLPWDDYERLLSIAEERGDVAAAAAAEQRRFDGEEYLPVAMADRIMNGESALKVWRKYRGVTQAVLAKNVGVSNVHICDIEVGKTKGKPVIWRKLAEALNVSVDDILPLV